ncbi:ABC transporter permease [Lactococcus allomyrinae]|uniref:Transport permease protein n=1 Tax=Lactococcus allomyrinae TaxID=2419773 RepID=A0A387BC76_9LACT|nr:ABC transporter permease [Lactococcus allomyrinae]AYG01475.1 ABC transporter permease [Lactococcus allomyrinae]
MQVTTKLIPATQKRKSYISSIIHDSWIMAGRAFAKTRHNPEQLFDVVGMPIFFMVLFTYIFGGAIAGNFKTYLVTIVPGILIQTLINASSGTGVQLREDMETGVFDRFRSLPIARISPFAGLLIADILRYAIAAVVSVITGLALGWRPTAGYSWLFAGILLVIFATWALSWIFAMVGLLIKSAATISGISMPLTMGLTFLSSAFVPISSLPKWLQHFANANPITFLINAFKEMVNHGTFGHDAFMVILISLAIVVVMAPLTILVYNKKA